MRLNFQRSSNCGRLSLPRYNFQLPRTIFLPVRDGFTALHHYLIARITCRQTTFIKLLGTLLIEFHRSGELTVNVPLIT